MLQPYREMFTALELQENDKRAAYYCCLFAICQQKSRADEKQGKEREGGREERKINYESHSANSDLLLNRQVKHEF